MFRRVSFAGLMLAFTLGAVPGPSPAPSGRRWTISDYHGTAQGLARVIHEEFGVNVILPASAQTTVVRLSLANGTQTDFIDALASQFSPALNVQHVGDLFTLIQGGSAITNSAVVQLHYRSAQSVVDTIKVAIPAAQVIASVADAGSSGQSNTVVLTGTADGLSAAQELIAKLDVAPPVMKGPGYDFSCAGTITDGLPSCFFKLNRLSTDDALYYLQKRFGAAMIASTIPEPEQGGILMTGSTDFLRTAGDFLWTLDQQQKRQLRVTVYVYDVVPFNYSRSLGVQYGNGGSTAGSGQAGATASASFTPGTFLRPNLLANTSGISAQISALDTLGTSRLVEAPWVTIALDPDVPSNGASSTSGIGNPQVASSTNISSGIGTNSSLGGSTAVPSITGSGQQVPGAAVINVGNTSVVPFSVNGFSNTYQIGTVQSGITLILKPIFVGADGLMRLAISANFNNITGYVQGVPQLGGKSLQTEAYIRDGESLSFGGLYADSDTRTDAKVPFLGDIPILGQLFKLTNKTASREQLVFFVVPKVETF